MTEGRRYTVPTTGFGGAALFALAPAGDHAGRRVPLRHPDAGRQRPPLPVRLHRSLGRAVRSAVDAATGVRRRWTPRGRCPPAPSAVPRIGPMYVVILAGGGGTRLWPLSSAGAAQAVPARCSAPETLLQRTVDAAVRRPGADRPGSGTATSRSSPTAAMPALVKRAAPRRPHPRRAGRPEHGRRRRPSPSAAIDRPDDEVMLVLPADHWIADEPRLPGGPARRAEAGLAQGAFGIEDPLVTLGIAGRPAGDRVRLPHPGPRARGETSTGLQALPAPRASRRSRTRPGPPSCARQPGVAWNAGIFLWRRRAIRDALERHTALFTLIGSVAHSEMALAGGLRAAPPGLDRPRGHGGRRAGRPGRHGLDGRRLERPRRLDRRSSRRSARSATGRVVPPGEDGRPRRRTTCSSSAGPGASPSSTAHALA